MVLYNRLDFTYVSKLIVCVEYLQQTSWMLPNRDTVTFIRLKVTEISMFFIKLSIKLHGGDLMFFQKCVFQSNKIISLFSAR